MASGLFLSAMMLLSIAPISVSAAEAFAARTWTDSHATWYGGKDGAGTMGGACGYGNMNARGYGMKTAALSTKLFNDGFTCGACFEIRCKSSQSKYCYSSTASVIVTATNYCPANPNRPTDGWCNGDRTHFDLTYQMFTTLAIYEAGIIPVQYRRVPCAKKGGIRFTINGNPNFNLILLSNVGGSGNVVSVQMKGENSYSGWVPMKQNWGQMWECGTKVTGQSISFKVTVGYGQTFTFWTVAPKTWQFGQTYEASSNVNDSWDNNDDGSNSKFNGNNGYNGGNQWWRGWRN
ncbi:hypothetical protein AXG93_2338s1180 [Marchantia polymorpha subsp. ruderalis]|nr:hypothetical protein AXG93_2338s1180 [Marchantia polymorpha subsp. ruderalis]